MIEHHYSIPKYRLIHIEYDNKARPIAEKTFDENDQLTHYVKSTYDELGRLVEKEYPQFNSRSIISYRNNRTEITNAYAIDSDRLIGFEVKASDSDGQLQWEKRYTANGSILRNHQKTKHDDGFKTHTISYTQSGRFRVSHTSFSDRNHQYYKTISLSSSGNTRITTYESSIEQSEDQYNRISKAHTKYTNQDKPDTLQTYHIIRNFDGDLMTAEKYFYQGKPVIEKKNHYF